MKQYIDIEELYPFYTLLTTTEVWPYFIELTDDEKADFDRVHQEFLQWQERLENEFEVQHARGKIPT